MKKLLLPFGLLLVCFTQTSFAQFNWQPTNGPEGAAPVTMFHSDHYAFCPDQYRLYRSADGQTWEQLPHGDLWPISTFQHKVVAIRGIGHSPAPGNPELLLSFDDGLTFTNCALPPASDFRASSLAISAEGIFFLNNPGDVLYWSADDGLTWDMLPAPTSLYEIKSMHGRLFARTGWLIYELVGGAWNQIVLPGVENYIVDFLVNNDRIYVARGKNLDWSSDHGATWTQQAFNSTYWYSGFAELNEKVYIFNRTTLFQTDTSGGNWGQVLESFANFTSLLGISDHLVCKTYQNGVYAWDLQAPDFQPASTGLFSAVTNLITVSGNTLWAACPNGAFAYDLVNQAWLPKAKLPEYIDSYSKVAISETGQIAAMISGSKQIFYSNTGGDSWDTLTATINGFSFYVENIFWLGNRLMAEWGGDVIQTTDEGLSWTHSAPFQSIVSFQGKYYALVWGIGLQVSEDQGASWQTISSMPNPENPIKIALYSTDDRLFLVDDYDGARTFMYQSTDGLNWTPCMDGLHGMDWESVHFVYPYRGGVWKSGSDYYYQPAIGGLYVTTNEGQTWLPVSYDLYKAIAIVDSVIYAGNFGDGIVKSELPEINGTLTQGTVYKDDNNNGLLDPNEVVLPGFMVGLKSNSFWNNILSSITGQDGSYTFSYLPGAKDSLRVINQHPYLTQVNPPAYALDGSPGDRNFGLYFAEQVLDLGISGAYFPAPRPGFFTHIHIPVENLGTKDADGVLSVKLAQEFSFSEATPPPSQIIGTDSLVWQISSAALYPNQNITIKGEISVSAILGATLTTHARITTLATDQFPDNNEVIISETIVGSFDPNEKSVSPSEGLTPAEIAAGKELTYTIQFQNTGTASAERVRIIDVLDTALNVQTLRFLSASHPVTSFRLLPNNILEVVFDMIALPDSNANEAESHGFVTFAIQRNKNFNSNYSVYNDAAIYFDFNAPIITNRVKSQVITNSVSTKDPSSKPRSATPTLQIMPNPANQTCQLICQDAPESTGILYLYDQTGKQVFQKNGVPFQQPQALNTSLLSTGVYLVRMVSAECVYSGRLVVSH